jgi:5-(carboxyamino)imidazole ribonucleotide synthase
MNIFKPGSTVGILGGGQLGKFLAIAASNLGFNTHIYVDEANSPAAGVANAVTIADYTDEQALVAFAKSVDFVTLEFENIPVSALDIISNHTIVFPDKKALSIAQNRLLEKEFAQSCGAKTPKFFKVSNKLELEKAIKEIGFPAILKTTTMGYDGKGQTKIQNKEDLELIAEQLTGADWILEEKILFNKEISVIVARKDDGEVTVYQPTENIHINGILKTSIAPARISEDFADKAQDLSIRLATELNIVGLLAIEYFVTINGELLFNEMAPRPHNSGHWTMDAAITSQFEQAIRAASGLPFGSTDIICSVEMINLIGKDINSWPEFIKDENSKLYVYGKSQIKTGRKMGHVTKLFF